MAKKSKKKFDWRKFFVKGAIRLAYRFMELVILFSIGSAFGLKLVKY